MRDVIGVNFEVVIAPKRVIDRLSFELGISLAKIELNWEPKVTLSQGIRKVWNSTLIS
jgi:nucleoside-diphosphate-sugar epimerase